LTRLEEDVCNALSCVLDSAGTDGDALAASQHLAAFVAAHSSRLDALENIRGDAFETFLENL
jgi:hypothetical protein